MDLIHKIESLRYDIENGVETNVIKISVRLIQIRDHALQLQQTGVSGSVLKENKCNYAMPDCKHCALANCIYLNDGGL